MVALFPNPFKSSLWSGDDLPEKERNIVIAHNENLEKRITQVFDADMPILDAIKALDELRQSPFKGVSLIGRKINMEQNKYLVYIIEELEKALQSGFDTMKMLDKSGLDRYVPDRPSPKIKPSRIGKRAIGVHVEMDAYNTFKAVSEELGVNSDYLMHRALYCLFKDIGVQIPKSIEDRVSDPRAKRPGRAPGREPMYKPSLGKA